MSLFTRMAESAGIGGVLGTAIGVLVGGAAITVTGAGVGVMVDVVDKKRSFLYNSNIGNSKKGG